MDNVRNKNILISGGVSGVGYKYAEILLRNDAKCIAIIDLPMSYSQSATTTLENEFGKGRALFFPCEITRMIEFETTFKKVIAAFGRLDILINNIGTFNDFRWEYTIDLNITTLIRSSLLAVKHMGKHKSGKGGTIVNISSVLGLSPADSGAPVYSATKYAVRGFSENLAKFYDRTGIRVVVMCPGGIGANLPIEKIRGKHLDFVKDEEIERFHCQISQSPDSVALAMLDLIQKGKNGAVWVSEGDQPPYAVDFPHYSQRALPV